MGSTWIYSHFTENMSCRPYNGQLDLPEVQKIKISFFTIFLNVRTIVLHFDRADFEVLS